MTGPRRIGFAAAFAVLLVVGGVGAAASDDAVTLVVDGPSDVEVGDEVVYEIRASTDLPVYSAEIALGFDADAVTVTDVSGGGYLSQNASTLVAERSADNDRGTVSYAESRAETERGVTGEGVLLAVTVRFDDAADQHLQLEDAAAYDPDVEELDVETRDLEIAVTDPDGTDSADDGSASDGGNGSASDGEDSATPESEWPASVDDAVRDAFATEGSVAVIATVDGDLDEIEELVVAEGGMDVTVLPSAGTVAFVGDEAAVRTIADEDDVVRVRLDTAAVRESAEPIVETATLSADTVSPGETAALELALENDGDEPLSETLDVRLDGTLVAELSISLEPGERVTRTVAVTADEPGEYDVVVAGSAVATLTVTESTPESTDAGGDDPAEEDVPGFGILLAALAIVIAGILLPR